LGSARPAAVALAQRPWAESRRSGVSAGRGWAAPRDQGPPRRRRSPEDHVPDMTSLGRREDLAPAHATRAGGPGLTLVWGAGCGWLAARFGRELGVSVVASLFSRRHATSSTGRPRTVSSRAGGRPARAAAESPGEAVPPRCWPIRGDRRAWRSKPTGFDYRCSRRSSARARPAPGNGRRLNRKRRRGIGKGQHRWKVEEVAPERLSVVAP